MLKKNVEVFHQGFLIKSPPSPLSGGLIFKAVSFLPSIQLVLSSGKPTKILCCSSSLNKYLTQNYIHTALATSLLHPKTGRTSCPIFLRILHWWIMPKEEGHHRPGSSRTDWRRPPAREAETKCSISAHFRYCDAASDVLSGRWDGEGDERLGDGDLSGL